MEKPDKKTSILIAAEKLFSQLGYEGTSTRHIAKESGCNMAMISYYFGSKDGVFMEIMSGRISAFKAELSIINEDRISAEEKLSKVIDSYARRILSNTSFHKMMYRELSLSQRPEMFFKIKDAMRKNLEVIERIIDDGISDGSFRQVDVRMLIATIVGTISNVAIAPSKIITCSILDINNPKDKEILVERLIKHLQDLVKTYLTPHK